MYQCASYLIRKALAEAECLMHPRHVLLQVLLLRKLPMPRICMPACLPNALWAPAPNPIGLWACTSFQRLLCCKQRGQVLQIEGLGRQHLSPVLKEGFRCTMS